MTTITDNCVYCGESTAFGATRSDGTLIGKFVNRIGVDDGWGCAECSGFACDECDKQIYLDTEVRVDFIDEDGKYHYGNYHHDCYDEKKHGEANYGY
jgi:hypothetical protein